MLIGSTTSIGKMNVFSKPELEELYKGMDGYLQGGVPLNVPAAIPIGQLARIVATLKAYHALAQSVADVEAGVETPGLEQMIPRWDKVVADARELLETKPPEAPKVVTPPSRLILPK